MKPANLKQHLIYHHPESSGKPKMFFEKQEYLKQKKAFKKTLVPNEKLMKASYLVALKVTQARKNNLLLCAKHI